MGGALLIARQDVRALAASTLAWVAVAFALLAEGLYFYALGVGAPDGAGQAAKASSEVLLRFFDGASAGAIAIGLLLGMRSIARDRERGTLVLLHTAPVTDAEIVLGKFAAGMAVVCALQIASLYMPALVLVHGRVTAGHIAVGYLGIVLLGSATLSVAIFASAIARSQATAAATAAALIVVLLLSWLLAKTVDPPWADGLEALALHHTRQRPFMRGELRAEHVVYYVTLTVAALFAATKALAAKRWT